MWRTHNHFVVLLSHTHTKVKEDGRKFLEVIFVALIVVMVSLICLPSMLLSHLVLSDSATPWTAARQAPLPFTISRGLLKCPLSPRCYLAISSSAIPFSTCPQSFPASGSFPMSWLFASGGKSIGALTSPPVLPMNIQGWFPLGLTGLISLLFKGLSRVCSSTTLWRHQFFSAQSSLWSNSHIHTWPLEKP